MHSPLAQGDGLQGFFCTSHRVPTKASSQTQRNPASIPGVSTQVPPFSHGFPVAQALAGSSQCRPTSPSGQTQRYPRSSESSLSQAAPLRQLDAVPQGSSASWQSSPENPGGQVQV